MTRRLSDADLAARTSALGDLCDAVAEAVGVDPEDVMYDVGANHVSMPASVARKLLERATSSE